MNKNLNNTVDIENIITPRLRAMADFVEEGETVVDIGTDHGYVPIYLTLTGKSPKAILADISRGSLKKARENGKELAPDKALDYRQGNGLKVIKKGEVDNIIIAGLGGNLIVDILSKDMGKARSAKKIILQPRSSQGKLRHWLIKKGFNIKEEMLVREGKFICEIIVVTYEDVNDEYKLDAGCESVKWELPPWLINKGGDMVSELLNFKLEREKRILKSMEASTTLRDEDKLAVSDNIKYLEGFLSV